MQVNDTNYQQVAEVDSEKCCCGCSLRCGVVFFGVMSIIQFVFAVILFALAVMVAAAVNSMLDMSNAAN